MSTSVRVILPRRAAGGTADHRRIMAARRTHRQRFSTYAAESGAAAPARSVVPSTTLRTGHDHSHRGLSGVGFAVFLGTVSSVSFGSKPQSSFNRKPQACAHLAAASSALLGRAHLRLAVKRIGIVLRVPPLYRGFTNAAHGICQKNRDGFRARAIHRGSGHAIEFVRSIWRRSRHVRIR